jgi:UDP-glucose 4-epimerase
MNATVLVTGGSGFIGSWVLRELLSLGVRAIAFDRHRNDERWQRVIGTDSARITFVAGTLQDRDLLRKISEEHQVTHLIHLAALLTPDCQRDPFVGCEVNVLGTVALFELARASAGQIKGISYASSYGVYGPEADDQGLRLKAAENRPPSFYGAFKLAADLIAEQYWRHFQIASVGIRPHVVYGPERIVGLTAGPSQAARAAALGERYTINYTGNVGYDYVEDVARAFVRSSLETPPGSTIVDLPSELATTAEFINIIDRVVPGAGTLLNIDGSAIPSNIPPQPHYISKLFPDWRATSIEEGVRATVDFYRKGT